MASPDRPDSDGSGGRRSGRRGRRLRNGLLTVSVVVVAALAGAVAVTALAGRSGSHAANAIGAGSATSAPAPGSIGGLQAQLQTEPDNWMAWASLGAAYVQQGRVTADPAYYPKAQQALQHSLSLNSSENYLAMAGMAALTAARHEFADSLRWSQRAAKVDPQSSDVYAVMTDALNELGRYDAALRAVQRAVDLKPGVATFTRVSYVRELRGDVPGAIEAMQRAREDAFSPADVAFCDYYLGLLEFNSGQLARAAGYFDSGLQADPTYALLYEGRAKVEAAQGKTTLAVADYTTAVNRFPSPQYLVEFGDYLTALGRHADAQRQYALVDIEDRLFRANGVNQDLETTLFEAEHGQVSTAVRSGRAEWNRRHSIIVADALGWALHQAGDDKEALTYARFATKLGYREATYYFHRGMIEKSLGEQAAARSSLTTALRINPYFSPLHAPQARRALADLGGAGR